ncbi:MAG: hypothetical protein JW801_03010 [Bacteroidales bacterium]|nr:hypothetical protein [Bacteroidales bacterium]
MKRIQEFFDFTRHTEKKIFISLAALFLILMPLLSLKSGISADEDKYHYPHGKNVYKYYTTMGKDRTCLKPHKQNEPPLEMYGAVFDVSTVIANKILKPHDEYQVRHIMNSMAGWTAILFAGLVAVMLGGWRAGIITMLLMFLSPRLLGHSYNNPKDIPFTATYIFTIWASIRFMRALNNQELLKHPMKVLNYSWPIALGIGLAIGVRVGGLLLAFYFLFFTGIGYLFQHSWKQWFKKVNLIRYTRILGIAVLIAVAGYAIGILLWPYAHEKPVQKTIEALNYMEKYGINMRQSFEGKMLWSNNMPWYYLPKFILITVPEVVLIGFLSLFFLHRSWKKENAPTYFFLLFVLIFPVFYIVYKDANLYGGWRHAMFVYPSMVVLAGMGIHRLLEKVRPQKYFHWGTLGILIILLALPLRHIIANHPNEYVYYNSLIGGIKGAYGDYEMDYFYNSQKAAADWLIENRIKDARLADGEKITVAMYLSMPYYFRDYKDKVKVIYVKYPNRGASDWDYYIMPSSYVHPQQLKLGLWPTTNTIHKIDVNGKTICAVFERKNRYDLEGTQQMQTRNLTNYYSAISLFKKALQEDPNYDYVQIRLTSCYFDLYSHWTASLKDYLVRSQEQGVTNQQVVDWLSDSITKYKDLSETACTRSLMLYPDHSIGLNVRAKMMYQEGNSQDAIRIHLKNLRVNPNYYIAYIELAQIMLDQKKYPEALKYLDDALNKVSDPNVVISIYYMAADIRDKQGLPQEAQSLRENARILSGQ